MSYLAGKYTALKKYKEKAGDVQYNYKDFPAPPALHVNIASHNELHFPHVFPHMVKEKTQNIQTCLCPKNQTPKIIPSYLQLKQVSTICLSKSLNSGLTSSHSTFFDIILTFVSTVFPAREKKK